MTFSSQLILTGHKTLLTQFRSSKKELAVFCPVETDKYDMCLKGCQMFYPGDNSRACSNPKCQEDRYDDAGRPKAQIEQLSLAKQLAHLLKTPQFRSDISYKSTRHTAFYSNKSGSNYAFLEDIFDGTAKDKWDGHNEECPTSDYKLDLAMYTDGFNPFKRGGVSMTVVAFVILNLSPELRLVSLMFCNVNIQK